MKQNISPSKLMLARREQGLSQKKLAEKLNITRATIINWEKGFYKPDEYAIKRLADILKKPIPYFLEEERPIHIVAEPRAQYGSDVDLKSIKTLTTENTITLPLLASIPAGLPDFSDKDIESFAQVPRYLFPGADFIIHCCGESMEPDIHKGDYCVIKKEIQPINNKIMLVKIEDGFTIKRIIKKSNTVELHPANGDHKIIKPKELKVIGLVIGYWHKIE